MNDLKNRSTFHATFCFCLRLMFETIKHTLFSDKHYIHQQVFRFGRAMQTWRK